MRIPISMRIPLRTKDMMTLANILCGFLSVVYVIEGDLLMASYAILVGYAFDALDGSVAKLLKQSNKFGAEFDNIADLITYSMAPSFLVYGYFRDKLPFWIALILGALPLAMGAVRFARFNVKRLEYPGCWIGFPRPASALLIIGALNSHLATVEFPFFPQLGTYIAAVVVAAAAFANLGLMPYLGHHNRKFEPFVKIFLLFLLASVLVSLGIDAALAINPFLPLVNITWDVLTVWLVLYGFVHQYYVFDAEERKRIAEFIRNWLDEEKVELNGG